MIIESLIGILQRQADLARRKLINFQPGHTEYIFEIQFCEHLINSLIGYRTFMIERNRGKMNGH